jgi:NitT/TauT family transport system substrate-binding protein
MVRIHPCAGGQSPGRFLGETMRRLSTVAMAASILMLTAACGGGGSTATNTSSTNGAPTGATSATTQQTQKVTVGVIPILDVAPIHLGKEKGFFADRGIDLTLESGQGGAAIIPGVVSGQFQFGFSNMTSLILAKSKNLPLKVVAAGNSSTNVDGKDFSAVVVKANSPIKSAKDLAGKTVSVNTLNNVGDTTVRESIRKAGGDPSTVKFVELAFPDMPAALEKGQIDAAWIVEPFVTIVKSQGARIVASNLVDTAPHLMIASYFTSEKLISEKPELVKAFTEAMNQSLEYADAHPDEARAIVATYTKIDKGLLDHLILPKWSTEINQESTQKLVDLAAQDGLISDKIDLSTLLP